MTTVTPRRSSRTRVERVPIVNDNSDEELSELESIAEDEDVASGSTDAEGMASKPRSATRTPRKRAKLSVTPSTKRTASVRKKTPLRKGSRPSLTADAARPASFALDDDASRNQIRIIDDVLDVTKKKSDLKKCVENWNRLYADDSNSAIASIMSFVLHLAGSPVAFPTSEINDDLNDPAFIKPFQASIEEANATIGLLNPNKTALKRFESRLKMWVSLWIEHMPQSVLYESDIIARTIEWATTLSQSSLRTVRLVACTFAFDVLDALIVARRKIQTQLSTVEKSLQQKSKRPAKAVAQMEDDKAEFQNNIESLDQHISAVFQEIFVPRYRDIFAAVRERCIESLRDWILSSDSFAADAYFKYIGWALNSSYVSVRLLAIRTVDSLVKSDSVRPKMESFLNRFVQRIMEMHNDVDETVAASAIETCSTLLVHDDILQNFESFGDVAPLLWDKSRVIREAAANYVFEDSFNPEGLDSASKASLQTDIEQLFTIYSEASPKDGSHSFLVSILVDLFFFKLPCVRNLQALVDALKTSAEMRSPNTKGERSLSHFAAELMLSCCEYASAAQDSHSRHSKQQQTIRSSVLESFIRLISESEFLVLLKQFQAEPVIFCCLVKLIPVVAKTKQGKDSTNNLVLCPDVGGALLAVIKRETNPVYLQTVAVALASVVSSDTDLERDVQQTVAELLQPLEDLGISEHHSDQTGLFALASLSRIRCISQQIYCPLLQESEVCSNLLMELMRITDGSELSDVAVNMVDNLIKIAHSVFLWGLLHQLDPIAVQKRVSRLLNIVKSLFSSSSARLCALAASVTADVSTVALNNPQIRFCLNDDLFHLMRDYISDHWDNLETVKAGARVVCAFCPEHVSICATLLCISVNPDLDDRFQQVIKASVSFLRSRNSQVLASAILEALLSLVKEKGVKDATSLSRRMAMSYGVTATSDSHFDTIISGGIDRFIDGDVDAGFLSVLHPFIHRCSGSMLKAISNHIYDITQSHHDESILKELQDFKQFFSRKLSAASATSVRAEGHDAAESIQEEADGELVQAHDEIQSTRSGL